MQWRNAPHCAIALHSIAPHPASSRKSVMEDSMKRRARFLLGILLASIFILTGVLVLRPRANVNANVFASPINGGCYIAGPNQCKIHIDPFKIVYSSNTYLVEYQIQANGTTIYHFKTDVSNPPIGPNYWPSLVLQDFAAQCGQTYTINIVGRDHTTPNMFNLGQFENVVCPAAVP